MTNYRRSYNGLTYFFTVVTHNRRMFLKDTLARQCLRQVWKEVQAEYPFEVIAFCLMPEHLHCMWRLPPEDVNYSRRWGLIKKRFSPLYIARGGQESPQSESRVKKREVGIWQRRFYEHQVRDEEDLKNYIAYTHYNPVKHGYAESVFDWPWFTIHEYHRLGHYREFDWNAVDTLEMDRGIEYDIE